jgi:hypothetical protein
LPATRCVGEQDLALERIGYDGPGDRHGYVPVGRGDRDHADDLVSQVRSNGGKDHAIMSIPAA